MGTSVASKIGEQQDLELAGIWTREADLDSLLAEADVIVDFSLPEGTEQVIAAAVRRKKPIVCGVSGMDDSQMLLLDQAATQIPIVFDRNMSLGIAVLDRVVRQVAGSLGPDFEFEISETHHVHKKDAPSGTALKLGEAVAASRGEAGTGSVHFEVERRGEVAGEHEVIMRSATECLTFAHSVTTRDVFADGALQAARWIVGQPPGRYRMGDVLFGPG